MELELPLKLADNGKRDLVTALHGNWEHILPILPAYLEDVQTILAIRNFTIDLKSLESILLELQDLLPGQVAVANYKTNTPHHRTVLLYLDLQFHHSSNKINMDKFYKYDKPMDTPDNLNKLYEAALNGTCVSEKWTRALEDLLTEPSAMETLTKKSILLQDPEPYIGVCELSTQECAKSGSKQCNKIHFQQILRSNTDVSLGDCSYLNTCFKGKNCRYVHYHISLPDSVKGKPSPQKTLDVQPVTVSEKGFRLEKVSAQHHIDNSANPHLESPCPMDQLGYQKT